MRHRLCCLKLSIEKSSDTMGDEEIDVTLEDSLQLKKVNLCYPIGYSSPQSRRYHIKEAIVIAMRRMVDQAVEEGLIDLTSSRPRGVSMTLNIPDTSSEATSATGFLTGLDA